MTTKWDDLVEVAARAEEAASGMDFDIHLSPKDREFALVRASEGLRALLAKGYVIVPGEPTYRMQEAAVFCDSDRWPTVIKAVIDAGSIKPEGE